VQDYKSLCAMVTICATLVNIQTHRKQFSPPDMKSSASWARNRNTSLQGIYNGQFTFWITV